MKYILLALLFWQAYTISCAAAEQCDINPLTDNVCYHVLYYDFCNDSDSMRTLCKEEFGIPDEKLAIHFTYKYFGYIKVSRGNHIDVIARNNEPSVTGKKLETLLRDKGIELRPYDSSRDAQYWWSASSRSHFGLPENPPSRYTVPIDHKGFRELLWSKLAGGYLGLHLFLTELCGETRDLQPVFKKEVFDLRDAPVSPKVYFDEHGTEMPRTIVHGFKEFPQKK